jgi:hypothetical protein
MAAAIIIGTNVTPMLATEFRTCAGRTTRGSPAPGHPPPRARRGRWAAAEAKDWTRFADLLAEHVVYEAPQTREQVRGQAAYLRFNIEGFPGDWHLAVERIVGEDRHAASWIQFTGEGGTQPGLCFFDLDDDRITRITDFWPDPYELPARRAHLVERY